MKAINPHPSGRLQAVTEQGFQAGFCTYAVGVLTEDTISDTIMGVLKTTSKGRMARDPSRTSVLTRTHEAQVILATGGFND